jgi:tRNA threonylcarbamoyladenosine biosynthesis protein TsaB
MYILHIDSTTKICSVAISNEDKLLELTEVNSDKLVHSEKLHLFIEECLRKANIETTDLKAINVSKGPGSYTGLRIGVSAAKGLAYGLSIPLISVDTLEAMADAVASDLPKDAVLIPMIDARRMEVFCSIHQNGKCLKSVSAEVLDELSFSEYDSKQVHFFGDGAAKAIETLNSDFTFVDDIKTSASNLIRLGWEKFTSNNFEDVAYFEPFYLKDFVAGKPKKML